MDRWRRKVMDNIRKMVGTGPLVETMTYRMIHRLAAERTAAECAAAPKKKRSRKIAPMNLRLTKAQRAYYEQEAKRNGRSLVAEIEATIAAGITYLKANPPPWETEEFRKLNESE
jgi:hypothetical protein